MGSTTFPAAGPGNDSNTRFHDTHRVGNVTLGADGVFTISFKNLLPFILIATGTTFCVLLFVLFALVFPKKFFRKRERHEKEDGVPSGELIDDVGVMEVIQSSSRVRGESRLHVC